MVWVPRGTRHTKCSPVQDSRHGCEANDLTQAQRHAKRHQLQQVPRQQLLSVHLPMTRAHRLLPLAWLNNSYASCWAKCCRAWMLV